MWSVSNPASSDPESLAAALTSPVAAASTSSMEDVGLGMSLDVFGAQNPILRLILFLLFLDTNFVPLESRVFQPQTFPIFSAREVGLYL